MNKNVILGIVMILLIVTPVLAAEPADDNLLERADKAIAISNGIDEILESDIYKSYGEFSDERITVITELSNLIDEMDGLSIDQIKDRLNAIKSRVGITPSAPISLNPLDWNASTYLALSIILLIVGVAAAIFVRKYPLTAKSMKMKAFEWEIRLLNGILRWHSKATNRIITIDKLMQILSSKNQELKRDFANNISDILKNQEIDEDHVKNLLTAGPFVNKFTNDLKIVLQLNKEIVKAIEGKRVYENREIHELRRFDVDYRKAVENRKVLLEKFAKENHDLFDEKTRDQLKNLDALDENERKGALELLYVVENINTLSERLLDAVKGQLGAIEAERGLLESVKAIKSNPSVMARQIIKGMQDILQHWNDEEPLYNKLAALKNLREGRYDELKAAGVRLREIVTTL